MGVDRLKHMKDTLTTAVEGQLGNLQNVDAKELGEVVDMVKDLEEAIYYCTITKAMEEKEKEPERHYYTPVIYPEPWERDRWERDMDRPHGRMYYPRQPRDDMGRFKEDGYDDREYYGGNGSSGGRGGNSGGNGGMSGSGNGNQGGRNYYTERDFPIDWRDSREGRSGRSRRMYMESKEMHKDKAAKVKELENYMKELSEDIVEMIQDASPEEKQILEKKIAALATKVASLPSA